MIHPPRDMVTMVGMLRTNVDYEPPALVACPHGREPETCSGDPRIGHHDDLPAPTKAEPDWCNGYVHGKETCMHCGTRIYRTSNRFPWFHDSTGDERCQPSTSNQEMNQ